MKALALTVAIESNNPSLTKLNNAGDEKIAKEDVQNMLTQIINALPSRCPDFFLRSRIENLTNTEIADKLSFSKRSVENQLSLALRHIRTHNIAWLFKMLTVLTLTV